MLSRVLRRGNFVNEVITKMVDSSLEQILRYHERRSLMEELAERGAEMGATAVYTKSRVLEEALRV